ncbi:DEAD/DEAH box helicase [Bacillus sp. RG28]|uniref:DEAD/DEAH box helicase n=1 Tax=Gottfriedia endophytica TaxID=2820819 RepID=A0A940SFY0_9BACI|nr:SNF2-related protein [Gottfriedia endophytica]MBP0724487.1 DEAD/DEAH box helicase [Gottfriedia endophytica]
MSIPIKFHSDWQESFLKKLEHDGPWSNWENYKLAFDTVHHLAVPTFDGMIAPSYLPGLTPLPHQLEVANTVIEKMNGKAILADEVGLGKTIEAGLILKEYMIRGLVKKVLILVPASLVSQWAFEMNTKFHIPAIAQQKKSYVWDKCDVVVSSIDTAKRAPHREAILDIQYDLIIIDEAHKLKNNKTKNYEFVQLLKKKFCLLLTATPVQNKIEEIFHLVSLLKPGHLGNKSSFEEYFSAKNRSFEHEDLLKELIGKVMVRNRRQDTGIEWTKRHVETVLIEFNEEERKLYNLIEEWQKTNYTGMSSAFSFLTFKREACSSREAVYVSMKKMIQRFEKEGIEVNDLFVEKIFQQINSITYNSKANKVVELIKEINDKVIIFTEYRATQLYLQWLLKQHGITSVPFRGGFKRGKKDWMKELFRNRVQVLIATEAGGEGINLQFCSNMINFDLPWNPMRLEQRIGRIHRLGQTEDVKIFNFATVGSIEEHILRLLYEKIHLFEKVIGELDDILTRIPYQEFEAHLNEIFLHSQSEGEMKIKMENLTSIIQLQQLKQSGDQYAAK